MMHLRSVCAVVASLLLPSVALAAHTAYTSNFENPVGAEWSLTDTDVTPKDHHHFLGQFVNDRASLKLDHLGPHRYLRVSFDLLILLSWDGNGVHSPDRNVIGPDFWGLSVERGPVLIWNTFSNALRDSQFPEEAKWQSFPSPVPGEKLPAMTGAVQKQALGFIWEGYNASKPLDAVYHISLVFPHTADVAQLNFEGFNLEQANGEQCNESWGLNHVNVEALDEADVKPPAAADFEALLEKATGVDPAAANEAFWRLVLGGPEAASFLRKSLPPAVTMERVPRLVRDLGAHDMDKREAAMTELRELGSAIADPALRRAARTDDLVERRSRAMKLLQELDIVPMPYRDRRRAAVAGRVIEIIEGMKD